MFILLLLLLSLSCLTNTMDAPKRQEDKIDPKSLARELMADKWDDSTTQKFKALDTYKQAEELNKELLSDNLATVFELSCINTPDEEKKFKSSDPHYFNTPSVTIIDTPEISLYKHSNPIKCISVNNSGQFVAADSANKSFLRKPDGSIFFYAISGQQIKTVKMHEIENMVSRASKTESKTFNAVTDEADSGSSFKNIKKSIFSSDAKWILYSDYLNQIFLTSIPSVNTWNVTSVIKNPSCLTFDDNGRSGLIGTKDDLFYVKITNNKMDRYQVDANALPDIDCVDITPDGRFGLATNNNGFCRINLQETDYPRVGTFCEGITAARIGNCGQFIVTGYKDGSIILHKVVNNEIVKQSALGYLLGTGKITCLSLSPDNKTLAAGSQNGLLIASCKNTYEELQKLSTSKLTAFLRLSRFGTTQLDNPLVKEQFVKLKTPKKYDYLKAKNIAENEEHSEDFLCPICSANIVDTSTVCSHEFCNKCLQSWKAQNATCPTCRARLNRPQAKP